MTCRISAYRALRSAAARRLAKRASTFLCGMPGRGSLSASCTLARNHASCAAALLVNANGSAPSFAVRVNRLRTASETVIPNSSSTAAARSFTAESIRVCTNAFAGMRIVLRLIVLHLNYISNSPLRHLNDPMTPSRPERAIQRPVLNRLRNVFRLKLRNSVQSGNRARTFQNAVMCARAEPLLRHGAFQQTLTIGGEFAEFTNGLRRHLGVAVEFLAFGRKARQLEFTGTDHALENFA